MSVTFGGLASGIDTGALIDQLVAAERSSAQRLSTKQSDLNTQKSIVNSLSSALSTFGSSARAMSTTGGIALRTATSSDAHAAVAASSSAVATAHTLRVNQLARAQVVSSRTFATNTTGIVGVGSVDLTAGGTTKNVAWDATDSLTSIAAKINDANAGTNASVLFDGSSYRLVLAAQSTGTAAAVSFVDNGDNLGFALAANLKVPPRDSIVEIDGITVTRGKNLIDDAVSGLTITANAVHAASDADTVLTVALDRDGVRDKIKAFVSSYNSVNSALHVQLDYTGTPKGTNTLFGDSMLRQLQNRLGSVMTQAYGGVTVGSIGITRDRTGAMTLDETKLTAALATNANAIEGLFVGGGFAATVTTMTDDYARAGDGILAAKTKTLTDRNRSMQTQIDSINRRADATRATLEQQFTALESAMSKLQSQSQYLSRILR